VVQITPLGVQNLQWRFYIIWTLCNAAIIPVIYLFYPETADRSLEDIERFFRENHEILVFKHIEATSVKRPQVYVTDEQNKIRENEITKGYEGVMVQHVEEESKV
jgi:Sugar (and other) transporter